MLNLSQRKMSLGLVDTPDVSARQLNQTFDHLNRYALWSGAYSKVFRYFQTARQAWDPQKRFMILDLWCGRGDLTARLARWAKRENLDIQFLGVDFNDTSIRLARDKYGDVDNLLFDVWSMKDSRLLKAQQVDYVVSSWYMHRQSHLAALRHLKTVNLLAKRGFVVVDIARTYRALYLLSGSALLFSSDDIREDMNRMVQKGWVKKELQEIIQEAEMPNAHIQTMGGLTCSISSNRSLELDKAFQPVAPLAGA